MAIQHNGKTIRFEDVDWRCVRCNAPATWMTIDGADSETQCADYPNCKPSYPLACIVCGKSFVADKPDAICPCTLRRI